MSSQVYSPGEFMAEDKNEKERLIKEKDREQLQKHFQKLENPVELLFLLRSLNASSAEKPVLSSPKFRRSLKKFLSACMISRKMPQKLPIQYR